MALDPGGDCYVYQIHGLREERTHQLLIKLNNFYTTPLSDFGHIIIVWKSPLCWEGVINGTRKRSRRRARWLDDSRCIAE